MWAWRYWDVALAIFGFFIQCGLAYMGLTMTHWKHKASFFGLMVLGAIFTGVAVKRGVDSANTVQTQLNIIQHNTETPPQITVNVAPSKSQVILAPAPNTPAAPVKSKAFMQLMRPELPDKLEVNAPFHGNLYLVNTGAEPAYNAYAKFSDAIVNIPHPDNAEESNIIDAQAHKILLDSALKTYNTSLKDGEKGVNVAVGGNLWNTVRTAPLTKEQVDGIVNGGMRLYVFAWSRWDKSQSDLEACMWLQPPGTPDLKGNLIWHLCWAALSEVNCLYSTCSASSIFRSVSRKR